MEAHEWDSEEFVTWMRAQMRRRGWNAAELSRRLEMPSGTISRWLRGERQPSPRSCDLIADLFAVDVDLVLTLVGHRPHMAPAGPVDHRSTIVGLLDRVRLTPDRLAGLEGTLRAWIDLDRAANGT